MFTDISGSGGRPVVAFAPFTLDSALKQSNRHVPVVHTQIDDTCTSLNKPVELKLSSCERPFTKRHSGDPDVERTEARSS